MKVDTDIAAHESLPLLIDAGAFLWYHRYRILIITLCFALIGGIVALTAPVRYQVATVVSMRATDDITRALPASLTSLAAMTGVRIGNPRDDREKYFATLTARESVTEFIVKKKLVPILEREDQSWLDRDKSSAWRAATFFMTRVLTVADDKRTGLVTVSITWSDPDVAADWCNAYVESVDNRLRRRVIENGQRSIIYLQKQWNNVTFANLKESIDNLMEQEMRRMTMAQVAVHFAYDIVDPAIPPEQKTSPQRSLIVVAFALFGLGAGVLALFLKNALEDLRHKVKQLEQDPEQQRAVIWLHLPWLPAPSGRSAAPPD